MTAILSIQNNTIYFEKFIREQLKTQENEARAELKDREIEIREMKAQKTMNDRIVEELRPLCEELPPDALDPVTYEPFTVKNIPGVFKCGHVFNKETIQSLILSNKVTKESGIPCPVCKNRIGSNQISECVPLEGLTEHVQKITKIFKEKM